MLLYENAFSSTYEEIKTWYPVWYRDVFEMDAIWRAFGGKLDEIQAGLIRMVNNNFIDFMDIYAVTRLENFLGIVHTFPRTLVERRTILRGFILGTGRIGRQTIIEILSLFTSGEIDVVFSRPGMIIVTVTRDSDDTFNSFDIDMVLGHRIPAHLGLHFTENYVSEITTRDNSVGSTSETVREFIMRVSPIPKTTDYDAAVISENVREEITQ